MKQILIVAGLGRCGSSLMMNMLHKGGMETVCGNNLSFETEKIMGLPQDHQWLEECYGKAVKVLDPHRWQVPKDYDCLFIWMGRNYEEQAKSQHKMVAAILGQSPKLDRKTLRKYVRILKRDETKCAALLKGRPVLGISFEMLLQNPVKVALTVRQFCGFDLDIMKMASAVHPRSPRNFPGFLELKDEGAT